MKWNLFKREPATAVKPVRFSDLSKADQQAVTRRLYRALQSQFGPITFAKGYDAVKAPFSSQRRPSTIEYTGEDEILNATKRNRIINLARDMMRNSPVAVMQDEQLRVNVVGETGGRLFCRFPSGYEKDADAVQHFVNRVWAPHAEFTDGKSLNWILKTALTAQNVSGACILVFDDGILSGGRGYGLIRGFEGDEIANLADADFGKYFPESCTQSQGLVSNSLGQKVGAFVSTSQRGVPTFGDGSWFKDAGKVLKLRRDPLALDDCNWTLIGDLSRFNQGKPASRYWAAVTMLVDLYETIASEVQAAKLNSQMVGQVVNTNPEDTVDEGSEAFEDEEDTDSAVETKNFTLDALASIGAHVDQLPANLKTELFDTKHPNANMPAFIDYLREQVGGAMGLPAIYATGKAQTSYTAARAEMLMAIPVFQKRQKELERDILDPMVRQAIKWGLATGRLVADLPDDWEHMLAFQWPHLRDVDAAKEQQANLLKLQTGEYTYKDIWGLDYDAKKAEIEKDLAWCRANGIQHPMAQAAYTLPDESNKETKDNE